MLASILPLSMLLGAAGPAITFREFLFGCDDRAALVERVKALDPGYLAELARYAASGQCAVFAACRPPLLDRLAGLGNRRPVFERFPRDHAWIKLSVCMDEGVMLVFADIGTPRASVFVSSSEDDIQWDRTLLWSASPASGEPAAPPGR